MLHGWWANGMAGESAGTGAGTCTDTEAAEMHSLDQRPASEVWLTMTAKEGTCVYSAKGRQAAMQVSPHASSVTWWCALLAVPSMRQRSHVLHVVA